MKCLSAHVRCCAGTIGNTSEWKVTLWSRRRDANHVLDKRFAQTRTENALQVVRRKTVRRRADDKNKDIENEDRERERIGKKMCTGQEFREREKFLSFFFFCYGENKFFSRVPVTASSITLLCLFLSRFLCPPLFFVIRSSSCLLKFSFLLRLVCCPTVSTTCCCSFYPYKSDLFSYMLLFLDSTLLRMRCNKI
jgi:hypothetical protein